MRLEINLASQPYQDLRRFLWRWGLALLAVAVMSVALVYAAVSQYRAWRSTNAAAARLRQQIAEIDREHAAAAAYLDQPAHRGTRDRSQFLNGLIARKAFSWTLVMADLEKIMPAELHVVSIKPTVNDENELQISLEVAGRTRDPGLELVRRMEQSPDFRDAYVENESIEQQTKDPISVVRQSISAVYVPPFARPEGGQ